MQTDNSIHLIKAARQRHEKHTRAKAIAATAMNSTAAAPCPHLRIRRPPRPIY